MAEDYSGMTVNERLSRRGLLHAYEEAVTRNDKPEIAKILATVGLRREPDGMHRPLKSGKTNAED